MGLRTKFNLVLLLVFAIGSGVTGYVSYNLLQKNARDEVLRNAGVIMEAALSMRYYTQKHVSPKLDYQPDTFLPESVPAFAATEMMNQLRKKYDNYNYKEAVLNPTNPRDRAVESWLHNQVGPAYDALKADPSRAVTADQVRARLAAEHAKAQ